MQYSNNYYRSSSATKKIHPERTLPQKNTVHCTGDCRKRKRNIKKLGPFEKSRLVSLKLEMLVSWIDHKFSWGQQLGGVTV